METLWTIKESLTTSFLVRIRDFPGEGWNRLGREVNEYIEKGYEPIGGPVVVEEERYHCFCQALVKRTIQSIHPRSKIFGQ